MLSVLTNIVSVFGELLVFDYDSSKQHEQGGDCDKRHTSVLNKHSSTTSTTGNHLIFSETAALKPTTNGSDPKCLKNPSTLNSIHCSLPVIPIEKHFSFIDIFETVEHPSHRNTVEVVTNIEPSPSTVDISCDSLRCHLTEDSRLLIVHNQFYDIDIDRTAIINPSLNKIKDVSYISNIHNAHNSDDRQVALNKNSSSWKRKNTCQQDFCTFERHSKKARHDTLSNQKHSSINSDNHRAFSCVTQLFRPKSIEHIQDEKNQLFSIVALQTSQNDEALLTQRTEECVNQIFDLIRHNSITNNTNQFYQAKPVSPNYILY